MKENKKTIIFIIITFLICVCLSVVIYRHEAKKKEKIIEVMSKAEFAQIEGFDEDKNISEKTYLISEKDIKIPVLLYHEFYEEEPSEDLYGLISTPEKFEQDMLTIIGDGYTFISLDRLIDYKDGVKGVPEKSVVLTFDDGYMSNYKLIYPILKKYNIPATIFIIEDMVGDNRHFSWKVAKEMISEGLISIYTHGHSHIDMTKLDINDFREKTANNLKIMEEKLGKQKHIVYSYPLGFYNDETNKVLNELGVDMYMTTNLGLNTKNNLENGMVKRNYIAYNFKENKLFRILTGK